MAPLITKKEPQWRFWVMKLFISIVGRLNTVGTTVYLDTNERGAVDTKSNTSTKSEGESTSRVNYSKLLTRGVFTDTFPPAQSK